MAMHRGGPRWSVVMTGRTLPFKCSAVISDVDGTLVTDDKILTTRTKAAVAALQIVRVRKDGCEVWVGSRASFFEERQRCPIQRNPLRREPPRSSH